MYQTVFHEDTKIWRGVGGSVEIDPALSCGTAILKALNKHPHAIGQINDNNGVQLTNAQIRDQSIRVAQNFLKVGLQSGDVVQIICRNHHNLVPFIFGAIFIGAPVNALDFKFGKDEIAHMLNLITPKLIVCDNDVIPNLMEAMQLNNFEVKHVYTLDRLKYQQSRSVDELLVETRCENEFIINDEEVIKHPMAIMYTSGTTGLPKGVQFSHLQMLTLCSMGGLYSSPEESYLSFSSLFGIIGWTTYLLSTLRSIKRILTTEDFSSDGFLRLVEKYKVTMVFTTPTSLALILQNKNLSKTNLTSIKAYFCGGNVVSHDLLSRMNSYLPNGTVIVGYGSTELGQISAMFMNFEQNSVGQLAPGMNVRILNEHGQNVGVCEEGEICVMPSFPMLGYYRDEESTKKAIDEFGWLHTGDIGYFDKSGTLYVIGRQKDVLKYSGFQVSPNEIENIVLKHPGVNNVCVVGIPDKIFGELPAAVIVKNNFVDLMENDVITLIRDQLSDTKQLRGGVYFMDDLPLTLSGKILRHKVQEMAIQKFKDNCCAPNASKSLLEDV